MFDYPSFSAWINSFLACMGACLGTIASSARYISVCYPSGDVHCHGQFLDSSSASDGFRTITAYDVDLRVALSKRIRSPPASGARSLSLISSDPEPGKTTVNGGGAPEFVNSGLVQWNQVHTQWITDRKKPINNSNSSSKQSRDHRIGLSATYNSLLGNNKPFRRTIPLSEMVGFLVDVWIDEGYYG